MMRELDYQSRVIKTFDAYLTELASWKGKADKIVAANADETDADLIRQVPDFPAKAWEAMRAAGNLPASRMEVPFSPRLDGVGRAVPNAVFHNRCFGLTALVCRAGLRSRFTVIGVDSCNPACHVFRWVIGTIA